MKNSPKLKYSFQKASDSVWGRFYGRCRRWIEILSIVSKSSFFASSIPTKTHNVPLNLATYALDVYNGNGGLWKSVWCESPQHKRQVSSRVLYDLWYSQVLLAEMIDFSQLSHFIRRQRDFTVQWLCPFFPSPKFTFKKISF